MFKIWDPTNFRRTLGGLCLILAPVLFAVAEITYPVDGRSASELLDGAARNQDLLLADVYIGIASAILFLPAVYALLHVTRRRGVVLGHIAAVMTVLGICLAHLAFAGVQLMLWTMANPGVDRQAMVTFLDRSLQNPAGAPLLAGHYFFALGLIVFGVAVWRSGFGYRWAGPAISIGVIVDIAGGMLGIPELVMSVVSDAIFVSALAAVGLKVLLTSDADWQAEGEAVRGPQPVTAATAATSL
jgi:hypothetical protein